MEERIDVKHGRTDIGNERRKKGRKKADRETENDGSKDGRKE